MINGCRIDTDAVTNTKRKSFKVSLQTFRRPFSIKGYVDACVISRSRAHPYHQILGPCEFDGNNFLLLQRSVYIIKSFSNNVSNFVSHLHWNVIAFESYWLSGSGTILTGTCSPCSRSVLTLISQHFLCIEVMCCPNAFKWYCVRL